VTATDADDARASFSNYGDRVDVAAPGARVYSTLELWNFSDTANDAGLIRFKQGKAPIGNYLTTVNSLTCSAFVWDIDKGISSASYALGL
jgi:subtilisin family serine protease